MCEDNHFLQTTTRIYMFLQRSSDPLNMTANISLTFSFVLGWAVLFLCLSDNEIVAAPIIPSTLTVNLLAEINGNLVTVHPNRTVAANGSDTDDGSRFFVTYPAPGKIRLESVDYEGNYLFVDELGHLILSENVNNTENSMDLSEWEPEVSVVGSTFAFRTQRNETTCFMAFDVSGESLPSCGNITLEEVETHICMILVTLPSFPF